MARLTASFSGSVARRRIPQRPHLDENTQEACIGASTSSL
jgi:hypothetical protein